MKLSISIRDYVYEKMFPLNLENVDINKSARIETLILKGLEKEQEELSQNVRKE